MYPVKVEGPRIYLRDFTSDDLEATMSIVGDPDVTAFLSFDTLSQEDQAARLQRDVARAQSDPRPDYYLAVVLKESDLLVGFARLGLGVHRNAKLGYAIRRDYWGRRLATEAAGTMLAFGFDTLNLHRITAASGPDNLASQRVLKRLGFTYEGRLREHVFTNGAWRDSLLYSLLEQEWRRRNHNDRQVAEFRKRAT